MSLKKKAIAGVIWTFAQQFSVQAINFGVQILLARLLMPEMFGLIAMLTVFIAIGQMLTDSGMTSSLIRTKDPDQLDYSTVFIANFMVGFGIYIIVFLIAPFIAKFYDQPILQAILRVYALTFVIRSFVAVHTAKLTKEMNFKLQMKLQVPSTIIGAIVGVYLAYSGYGVWSLVWLNISQAIVFAIQNWVFIPWRPSFIFHKGRFKHHFNFGYKMTVSGLLDTVYNNAYNIVIGKFFSPALVGFYNQADHMRLFPVMQLSNVMGKVTFPLFASLEDDSQLRSAYRNTMKLVSFAVIPVMLILIIAGDELFLFLFGEKWLPAVPYFQILSFASIVRPVSTYNLNILKVKGRSDLFLKIEVIKKIIGIVAMVIALPYGITALVVSLTIVAYCSVLINMVYCGKLINYGVLAQMGDVLWLYVVGFLIAVLVYFLKPILLDSIQSNFWIIALIGFIYIMLYVPVLYLVDRDMFRILLKLVKK